jgi:beta-ribofuranosylaminobenzene 5'-phosphate synthase
VEKTDFLPSSASKAKPAPILVRHDFPDWKIALVIPKGKEVSGKNEKDIFQQHCPIMAKDVQKLSRLVLMKMLPAVVETNIEAFGESVNEIQGIGFKAIEVGLQSPKVKDLLARCQKSSLGAGLSSFGPTIYCVVDDSEKLIEAVEGDARVVFTKAKNTGTKSITK